MVLFFLILFYFGYSGVWLEEDFVRVKPWCKGLCKSTESVGGVKNESVTVCFNVDTFRQAFRPLVTAFPLTTEGYWLTAPLPGLTPTTAISHSVLHSHVTTAWSLDRLLVDREPVEISSIGF